MVVMLDIIIEFYFQMIYKLFNITDYEILDLHEEWVNRKLHNIESSDQFEMTNLLLKEIKDTIVASYKRPDKDRKSFPIHDWKIMLYGVGRG
jgi:hypothetical protein